MERTMTIEEKVRRAEEIYERRRQNSTRPVATVNIREKKDIKLLKKMIIQLLVCVAIYLIIYSIHNNNYVFSQDFIKKANEILSYNINFQEIYNKAKEQVTNLINPQNNQENRIEDNTENNVESNEENNKEQINTEQQQETSQEENIIGGIGGQEETNQQQPEQNTENLSQIEKDILMAKNTTTFIKPIEGTISSKYGRREAATGNVPKNHTGTDIAANLGTKIKASTDGEVVLASEQGDYGKHLKIQIGEISIIYAHCNALYVKQGDIIKQGQEIAEVGSTRKFNWTTFAF